MFMTSSCSQTIFNNESEHFHASSPNLRMKFYLGCLLLHRNHMSPYLSNWSHLKLLKPPTNSDENPNSRCYILVSNSLCIQILIFKVDLVSNYGPFIKFSVVVSPLKAISYFISSSNSFEKL